MTPYLVSLLTSLGSIQQTILVYQVVRSLAWNLKPGLRIDQTWEHSNPQFFGGNTDATSRKEAFGPWKGIIGAAHGFGVRSGTKMVDAPGRRVDGPLLLKCAVGRNRND
jgi:hypothetical protein